MHDTHWNRPNQAGSLSYAQRVAVTEARIPDLVVAEGLRKVKVSASTARAVLRAICSFGPAGGYLWPSRARVAEKAGVSLRTATRALKALCRAGILIRKKYIQCYGKRLARYRVSYKALRRWLSREVKARLSAICRAPSNGCHHGTQGTKPDPLVYKTSQAKAGPYGSRTGVGTVISRLSGRMNARVTEKRYNRGRTVRQVAYQVNEWVKQQGYSAPSPAKTDDQSTLCAMRRLEALRRAAKNR